MNIKKLEITYFFGETTYETLFLLGSCIFATDISFLK